MRLVSLFVLVALLAFQPTQAHAFGRHSRSGGCSSGSCSSGGFFSGGFFSSRSCQTRSGCSSCQTAPTAYTYATQPYAAPAAPPTFYSPAPAYQSAPVSGGCANGKCLSNLFHLSR